MEHMNTMLFADDIKNNEHELQRLMFQLQQVSSNYMKIYMKETITMAFMSKSPLRTKSVFHNVVSVSYTHLDVYKRQLLKRQTHHGVVYI